MIRHDDLKARATGFWMPAAGKRVDEAVVLGAVGFNQEQVAPTNRNNKMIQTDGGADVTNKALRFGIATDGTLGANNAVLTANLTSTLNLSKP